MGKVNGDDKCRYVYIDLVKAIAIWLVLFAHSYTYGAKLYYLEDTGKMLGMLYRSMDCFRTINNSLFFMASGALLFGKGYLEDETDKKGRYKFYLRIIRFILVIVLFSAIQYFFMVHTGSLQPMSIKDFFVYIYNTPIHYTYWFLYAYLAFLILLPFTQKIAISLTKRQFYYLVIVTLLFVDFFPLLSHCLNIGGINISLYLTTWNYSVQPIVGYFLHKNIDSIFDKPRKLIIFTITSLLGIFIAQMMTLMERNSTGVYSENYISLFNFIVAITVYVWVYKIGKRIEGKKIICKVIELIGESVFVIYLLENIIEYYVGRNIYKALTIHHKLIACVFIWIPSTIVVGCLIKIIIKKVPILNKLL